MKRLAILPLLISFTFFNGCTSLVKLLGPDSPVFNILDFRIANLTFTHLDIEMDTELVNPYPVRLPESALDLDLSINGSKLTNWKSEPISVAAKGKTPVPMKFQVKYSDLYNLVQAFSLQENFKLGMNGNANFPLNIPGMPQQIAVPLNVEKTLPVFVPEVDVSNFSVDVPSLGAIALGAITGNPEITTSFDMNLKNKAAAQFFVKNLNYDAKLAGYDFLKGSLDDVTKQADNSQNVTVKTALPLKSLPQALVRLARSGSSNFQVNAKTLLEFPGTDVSSVPFAFSSSGMTQ